MAIRFGYGTVCRTPILRFQGRWNQKEKMVTEYRQRQLLHSLSTFGDVVDICCIAQNPHFSREAAQRLVAKRMDLEMEMQHEIITFNHIFKM